MSEYEAWQGGAHLVRLAAVREAEVSGEQVAMAINKSSRHRSVVARAQSPAQTKETSKREAACRDMRSCQNHLATMSQSEACGKL
jgi:hypothetical protein